MARYGSETFLGSLEQAEVDLLLGAGRIVWREPGEALCREGDAATAVFFVLAGSVKLCKVAESGREVVLELRGRGEVLGEMGVVDGAPRSASAIGLDRVEALVIESDRFRALLLERPALAHRLLEVVVARLRQASGRQLELGSVDVMGRVCTRLVELAASHGVAAADGIMVRAGISQQELADWAGTSRDGVVRVLRDLRELGLVESGRARILIRDLAALRERAGANSLGLE